MVVDINTLTSIISTLGFSSTESFLALLFIVLAVVSVIVVVTVIKPVLDIYPYTYPNARVRGRMGRLFKEKDFSEIIESDNIEEMKNYLRGIPDYAKYIDKYPLEKVLDTQLAETYDLIARIAPDNSKEAFTFLLKKWDIKNIKSIIIAKKAGLSREETLEFIVPFGALHDKLDTLIDSENINDVLLPLEASLEKYLLENLLRTTATPEEDNTSFLHKYVGNLVDTTNIKTILRAKVDGLRFDDVEPYMISDGYQIREWKLKDLMEAEDVAAVINGLEGTDYAPLLSEELPKYSETGSVSTFETALNDHVNQEAKKIALKNQFGIGPMIGFLNSKEVEIKNLKIIARGKREESYTSSMIKEMLI